MIEISNWLAGTRNYDTGVALYTKYGGSEFYKKLFTQRNDVTTQARLADLLAALLPEAPAQNPKHANVITEVTAAKQAPKTDADNKKYLDLLKRKGNLYTELNFLMAQRLSLPEGDVLRDCALQILATNQKLRECWAQIDYYQDNGHFEVKQPAPVVVMDPDQRAQHLRQSISKCKARLAAPGCRNRAATQKLLDERMAELATLKPKKQKTA